MLGYPEIVLILALALLVLGPAKLPEMARALGNAMREFRKATNEFEQATRSLEQKLPDLENIDRQLPDLSKTIENQISPPKPSNVKQEIRNQTIRENLNKEATEAKPIPMPSTQVDNKLIEVASVLGIPVKDKEESVIRAEILEKMKTLEKKEVE